MGDGAGQLRRALGPLDATAVVIGAIVGVGIFFTPSRVADLAGRADLTLLAWGLGGVVAMLGALTFAELGALYPNSGGQYEVLRDGYGAPVGFTYVVCNATATQAGSIVIIAIVTVQNGAVALAGVELGGPVMVAAACVLTGLVAITNALGVRWGALVQNLTVIAKLASLVAVVAVAAFAESRLQLGAVQGAVSHDTAPHGFGFGGAAAAGVVAAMVPVLFSFGGWQQVSWIGGEVEDPQKNLPRAILWGVVIVVAVYLAASWAYLSLLGHAGVAQSETLASDAVAAALGERARRGVAAAIAVSALGVLNA